IQWLELQWIPFFIGLYILLIQWSQHFNRWIRKFEHFFWVGFLQTGLGVFVGTPGPLNIAVLNKHYDDTHIVVSTGALMMSVVHTAKLLVYIALGFSFIEYWRLLVFMMVMAVVGSWFGTLLRHKIRMDWIKKVLPYLLSILAIKLMISVVWEQWF
ncbi:MAG: sulfite exporter TauE/SafE family protein, partial [Acinetobacter sp.]|nr:sulfite exporter TauE/SafE family protein [Acinetobacter sp.]